MVRFKFLLFALLVLGLGAMILPWVSGPLSVRATEGAAAPNQVALAEVTRALQARRLAVQGVALDLAGDAEVAASVQPQVEVLPKGKGIRVIEPPTAERFTALRAAAQKRVPEPLRDLLVLGLVTSEGTLAARGGGEALASDKLDVPALQGAGSAGKVVEAFGAPHVFFSVPVLWNTEGGRPEVAATIVVGAPLVEDKLVPSVAISSGVAALTLMHGDEVLGTAGQKEWVDEAQKVLVPGKNGTGTVQHGSLQPLSEWLPQVRLPILTHGDLQGGEATLALGTRRVLEGGLELVAVSSTVPFMQALADYQRNVLFALLGLAGFSLVWLGVMGMGLGRGVSKASLEQAAATEAEGVQAPASRPVFPQTAAPLPLAPVQEPPGPGPDDFPFTSAPIPAPAEAASGPEPFASSSLPPPVDNPFEASPAPTSGSFAFPPAPEPLENPFAAAPAPGAEAYPFSPAPAAAADPFASPTVPGKDPFATRVSTDTFPFSSPEPVAATRGGAFAFEDQPTASYSLQQAANPFAAASAQAGLPSSFGEEPSPEPTRVAAIPQELLDRAARPMTADIPLPPQRAPGHPGVASSSPPVSPASPSSTTSTQPMGTVAPALLGLAGFSGAGAVALSEEQHFRDVFREFVVTRDQCGEPNDGLTYDKFVAKLRKNKEQLVQKYACKTVRFQVYVKEGKAALKATPVKD